MTKKRHNGSPALVSLTGEIRAADLDQGTFILRLPDGTRVRGTFSPVQEAVITGALREHATPPIVSTRARRVSAKRQT